MHSSWPGVDSRTCQPIQGIHGRGCSASPSGPCSTASEVTSGDGHKTATTPCDMSNGGSGPNSCPIARWLRPGRSECVTRACHIVPSSRHDVQPFLAYQSRCGTYVAEPKTAGRSLARRAEKASDLGGDTGNRTPDLLLANSRLSQRVLSLSAHAPQLAVFGIGSCRVRCRTYLEYESLIPEPLRGLPEFQADNWIMSFASVTAAGTFSMMMRLPLVNALARVQN